MRVNNLMVWRVKEQDVVHETLDGEVVIVHLRHGQYFSLTGSGATLWGGLERGLDEAQLARLLAQRYELKGLDAGRVVTEFLTELAQADLVGPDELAKGDSCPDQLEGERVQFLPPTLVRHEDMAGLLLLDPVHEVADEGWPTVKS